MIKKDNPVCRKCGAKLNNDNWNLSHRKTNQRICKSCQSKRDKKYYKEHFTKIKEKSLKQRNKDGGLRMEDNKECTSFLGVHIAEKVLSKVFKNVEVMPYGNSGYDFLCNKGKKIDAKASCEHNDKYGNKYWRFGIQKNKIADYFLCIAFDNRINLNPLYLWLLPSNKFNKLTNTVITKTTINKWDEYRLSLDKVLFCCNILKGGV